MLKMVPLQLNADPHSAVNNPAHLLAQVRVSSPRKTFTSSFKSSKTLCSGLAPDVGHGMAPRERVQGTKGISRFVEGK